jgi:hypothetical protein
VWGVPLGEGTLLSRSLAWARGCSDGEVGWWKGDVAASAVGLGFEGTNMLRDIPAAPTSAELQMPITPDFVGTTSSSVRWFWMTVWCTVNLDRGRCFPGDEALGGVLSTETGHTFAPHGRAPSPGSMIGHTV